MRPEALLLSSAFLFGASSAAAQAPAPVRYEVSVASTGGQLLRARGHVPTTGMDTLRVSLRRRGARARTRFRTTPGTCHFGARGPGGAQLWWDRLDKDTWRVATGGAANVTVEFDLLADTIDLARARDQGLRRVPGHEPVPVRRGKLDRPAEVRFRVPEGWDVMTALRPAVEARTRPPTITTWRMR
jgi:predicted metalloprotease with PDZ domain